MLMLASELSASESTPQVKRAACCYPCRFTVVRKLRDIGNEAIFSAFDSIVTKTQYMSCLITCHAPSQYKIAVNGWLFFIGVIDICDTFFSNFMVSLTCSIGK